MPTRTKVGVLTFHKCINYGSYWQARCLVEALRARGHDAELLDHDCRNIRQAEVRCALQPKLPQRTPRLELRAYGAKVRRFIESISRLPMSRPFSLYEPEAAGNYDAIVVGSDEVWNFRHPWYGSKPIFFGEGLRSDRLISYAASFGNHGAWDGISDDWARKLSRFSAISVRDENSRQLVEHAVVRDAAMVLDPCLQFPEAVTSRFSTGVGDYALVYGTLFPDWFARKMRRWADTTGVRLVSIGYSNGWADEQRIGCGPIEFARTVAGARSVITNYFHGCVFALMFGKPWIAVPSDYRAIKIPDLAALLGVEHRLVDEQTPAVDLADLLGASIGPNFAPSLVEHRSRSEAYLNAALS